MTFQGLRVFLSRRGPGRWIGRWVLALLIVIAATILGSLLHPLLALGNPFALSFLYFAMVLGISFRLGIGPAILATFLSALGMAIITITSSPAGVIAGRELLLRIVFFAAQSLLGAALIHAARRRAS
jgi:hypothetical protein